MRIPPPKCGETLATGNANVIVRRGELRTNDDDVIGERQPKRFNSYGMRPYSGEFRELPV